VLSVSQLLLLDGLDRSVGALHIEEELSELANGCRDNAWGAP
jgi:hypothetical protein